MIKEVGGRIAVDPLQGGLWIGFSQGGIAYLRHGQIERSYTTADGLGDGRISHLRVDREGALWASTEGGLSRIKDGHVATLSAKNGLPCDAVHWSEEDAGPFGLAVPGMRIGARIRIRDERVGRGPKSNRSRDIVGQFRRSSGQVSYLRRFQLAGHRVLGRETLVQCRKRHQCRRSASPSVQQTSAAGTHRANHRRWQNLLAELVWRCILLAPRLPPLVRDLTIDYTALSLVVAREGALPLQARRTGRDWREVVNDRQVQYSNLPPGNYRFRVTACNNSGVWNEEGAALDFCDCARVLPDELVPRAVRAHVSGDALDRLSASRPRFETAPGIVRAESGIAGAKSGLVRATPGRDPRAERRVDQSAGGGADAHRRRTARRRSPADHFPYSQAGQGETSGATRFGSESNGQCFAATTHQDWNGHPSPIA